MFSPLTVCLFTRYLNKFCMDFDESVRDDGHLPRINQSDFGEDSEVVVDPG